jgi:hypothetical protein
MPVYLDRKALLVCKGSMFHPALTVKTADGMGNGPKPGRINGLSAGLTHAIGAGNKAAQCLFNLLERPFQIATQRQVARLVKGGRSVVGLMCTVPEALLAVGLYLF